MESQLQPAPLLRVLPLRRFPAKTGPQTVHPVPPVHTVHFPHVLAVPKLPTPRDSLTHPPQRVTVRLSLLTHHVSPITIPSPIPPLRPIRPIPPHGITQHPLQSNLLTKSKIKNQKSKIAWTAAALSLPSLHTHSAVPKTTAHPAAYAFPTSASATNPAPTTASTAARPNHTSCLAANGLVPTATNAANVSTTPNQHESHALRLTPCVLRHTPYVLCFTHQKTIEAMSHSLRQIPHRQVVVWQRYYMPGQDCIYFDFVFNIG
jgi:hypothetical protein